MSSMEPMKDRLVCLVTGRVKAGKPPKWAKDERAYAVKDVEKMESTLKKHRFDPWRIPSPGTLETQEDIEEALRNCKIYTRHVVFLMEYMNVRCNSIFHRG